MPVVSPEQLVQLQHSPDSIRNICILAHVDHGKTSLTDALIATNGIISPRLAGKVRYLDSRPDEQLRGITMESSAISLYFSMLRRSSAEDSPRQQQYLINLIDSPGHIDFSSEVSVASRLCDGAVILVDAVEGVCSQTVTVLRQTWIEHLQPMLVINKIDRLVTELKMSPGEAYVHMSKILEQVNAVMGTFFQGERMEQDLKWRERIEEHVAANLARSQAKSELDPLMKVAAAADTDAHDDHASATGFEEKDDEDIYFAPEKNNVIFSSALDGWGFTVRQFAGLYEKKLGIKKSVLEKVLWGDYYLDPKTKRVLAHKHLKGRALKPMFVQLVLENIWAVYEATTGRGNGKGDPSLTQKILNSLAITLPAHILRSKDPRSILTSLFGAWLPLSTAILVSVVEYLPSPPVAQAARLPAIIDASPGASHVDEKVRAAMVEFQSRRGQPVVAYVSKMFAVPESQFPDKKRRAGGMTAEEAREAGRRKRAEIARAQALAGAGAESDSVADVTAVLSDTSLGGTQNGSLQEASEAAAAAEDPEHLIGFARLYSGTLSVGDEIYVLPPKFSPAHPHGSREPSKTRVTALYLMMGRNLESLESVPAGVVFGIAGLEGHILKSGTLCSQVEGGVNLAGLNTGSPPIVRVALEPVNPGDLDRMIHGLRLLEQSDPSALYEVLESGEHVIATAGELHLERCLKDLRERFAKCEIQAGEPIVPYRETIVIAPEMAPPKNKDLPRGTVIGTTTSKQLTVRLTVRPLPGPVTEFLIQNGNAIRTLQLQQRKAQDEQKGDAEMDGESTEQDDTREDSPGDLRTLSLAEFKEGLKKAFREAKAERDIWADTAAVERIAAFGPRRVGPNVLIDSTDAGLLRRFLRDAEPADSTGSPTPEDASKTTTATVATTTTTHRTSSLPEDISDKISYAFQLATAQGPLCHEPMQGVAVFLEDVSIAASLEHEGIAPEMTGSMTGEAIKTVRDAIRQGFLDWSPRLMLAMYSCEIQASTEVLGRVYAVLTRRRGRVLSESLKEGTAFFTVLALLPVAESFGFGDEMRKRTSGAASPQLRFRGFDPAEAEAQAAQLDQDPFWVPSTEEEIEDLGHTADRENVAKRYMDRVRARKGLFVTGRKLVERAEKQKTLKR